MDRRRNKVGGLILDRAGFARPPNRMGINMNRISTKIRLISFAVASILISAQLMPGVVLACEGGGPEVQKISIKPIKTGGKCEEEGGRVAFKALNETCEYRVENENAIEKVEVTKRELGFEAQCEGFLVDCLSYIGPVNAPECIETTKLGVLGVCYVTLEYTKKPAAPPSLSSLEIKTESEKGGKANLLVGQKLT